MIAEGLKESKKAEDNLQRKLNKAQRKLAKAQDSSGTASIKKRRRDSGGAEDGGSGPKHGRESDSFINFNCNLAFKAVAKAAKRSRS